jgi:DNA-binding MarR family transcriptional regulator
MNSIRSSDSAGQAGRRRLNATIRQSLREVIIQLSLLSHHVATHVHLNDVDLDCLDLITRFGPLSPSDLVRRTGLHPATMTGILDRLERGGWVVRQRDPADRRAVAIRAIRDRSGEILRLYSGMNTSIDEILNGYADTELEVLADFLHRIATAGRRATDELADR